MSEKDNWGNMPKLLYQKRSWSGLTEAVPSFQVGIIEHNKKILDDYKVLVNPSKEKEQRNIHRYIRKKLLDGEYYVLKKSLTEDENPLYNEASEILKNYTFIHKHKDARGNEAPQQLHFFPENLPNYKPFYDTKHFLKLYSTLEIIETVVTFNNYYEYMEGGDPKALSQYEAFVKKVKNEMGLSIKNDVKKPKKQWVKNFEKMIKVNDNFFECFKKTCLDKKNGMRMGRFTGNSGKLFLKHLKENLSRLKKTEENGTWEQATDIYFQQFEDNFMIKLEKATKEEIYDNAIDGLKSQSGGKSKRGTRRRKRKSKSKSKTKRKSL